MGIFDFLFEDNNRRPPRKKGTSVSTNNHEQISQKTRSSTSNRKRKIKAADFHRTTNEPGRELFKKKSKSIEDNQILPSSESKIHKTISENESTNKIRHTTQKNESELARNLQIQKLLHKFLYPLKEALGENYIGIIAFDTLSEASVTDNLSPVKTYEKNIKKALNIFNGLYPGKATKGLLVTETQFVYIFMIENFVFNVFVSRQNISEGILLHTFSHILKETN